MTNQRPLDLPGRLFSASCLLLLSALALNLAVGLVQEVWPWLVTAVAAVGAFLLLVRLALWWHRRRLW